MKGGLGGPCPACGEQVFLADPRLVELGEVIDGDGYERAATLSGTCAACGTMASTIGPVLVADGPRSFAILALPGQPLPAEVVGGLIADLAESLPPSRQDRLDIYPTYEEFALERDHPEIFSGMGLDEIFSHNVDAEQSMIELIANALQEAGKPLLALDHVYQILLNVPDLLHVPAFMENLELLQALAAATEPDNPQVSELADAIALLRTGRPEDGRPSVTWRTPYAFGPDAPLLRGVPAGYVTPAIYVRREKLPADDQAVASLLILLFSSAARRNVPEPSADLLFTHGIATQFFLLHWRSTSAECQQGLIDFYRKVSGRSLIDDLGLDKSTDAKTGGS